MKTTKHIFNFLTLFISITVMVSCSGNDDSIDDLLSAKDSYYEVTIDGTKYENKEVLKSSATIVKGTDQETQRAFYTIFAYIEDEGLKINAFPVKIDGDLKPFGRSEDENSAVAVTLNNKMYTSKSGTITIKKDAPYSTVNSGTDQVGKTETLLEFSGTFTDSNDVEVSISGTLYVAKQVDF